MNKEALEITASELDIVEKKDHAELRKQIVDQINYLIEKDFQRLVSILYRLDVSEEKLREALNLNSGFDAGEIITTLILERQAQKIESKRSFKAPPADDSDERW